MVFDRLCIIYIEFFQLDSRTRRGCRGSALTRCPHKYVPQLVRRPKHVELARPPALGYFEAEAQKPCSSRMIGRSKNERQNLIDAVRCLYTWHASINYSYTSAALLRNAHMKIAEHSVHPAPSMLNTQLVCDK